MKIISLTTAILFAITGVLELAHEQVNPFTSVADYLIEGAFTAALACGATALWQLRERGNRHVWTVAAFGCGVLALAAGATFARGQESLGPVFPLGVLAITAGFLAASVQDVRGRLVARGAGLALLAGWALTVATDSSLALAAGWVAVALLEQRRRGEERLHAPAAARA